MSVPNISTIEISSERNISTVGIFSVRNISTGVSKLRQANRLYELKYSGGLHILCCNIPVDWMYCTETALLAIDDWLLAIDDYWLLTTGYGLLNDYMVVK
jgi:hypothetical protein